MLSTYPHSGESVAIEIERKYLVNAAAWPVPPAGVRYRQGYLCVDADRVVRVRTAGDRAFLTVKGPTKGITRAEFEFPIPFDAAVAMLERLCVRPLIEKTRYRVEFAGRLWEVDVFDGENAGLMLAEVELPAADAQVVLPPWVGTEVSADPRYYNSNLVANPYSRWGGVI